MESVIFLLHWPALRGQQCLSCGYTVPSKTIRTSSWCWTIALAAILPTRSDPTSVDTLPAPSADTCPSLCSAVTHPQLSMFVRLSPSAVAFYAAEVILALEELHRQGILYRSVRTTQPACTRPSRGYGLHHARTPPLAYTMMLTQPNPPHAHFCDSQRPQARKYFD